MHLTRIRIFQHYDCERSDLESQGTQCQTQDQQVSQEVNSPNGDEWQVQQPPAISNSQQVVEVLSEESRRLYDDFVKYVDFSIINNGSCNPSSVPSVQRFSEEQMEQLKRRCRETRKLAKSIALTGAIDRILEA